MEAGAGIQYAPGAINGKITDADGEPVRGVTLQVQADSSTTVPLAVIQMK